YATVPVREGFRHEIQAAAKSPLQYVTKKGQDIEVTLRPDVQPILAPISTGAEIGTLEAVCNGRVLGSTPLIATTSVEKTALINISSAGPSSFFLSALIGPAVVGYGTAIAKTARRRGYRLSALLRGITHRR